MRLKMNEGKSNHRRCNAAVPNKGPGFGSHPRADPHAWGRSSALSRPLPCPPPAATSCSPRGRSFPSLPEFRPQLHALLPGPFGGGCNARETGAQPRSTARGRGGELVGITAHRGCAPGPDAVSVREGSPGAGYNPQHSPTGARLVEEVPAVTCPAPVSAGAAALLELEGDGSTERLEPPRPAAAAGGARGTRHARPDPLH